MRVANTQHLVSCGAGRFEKLELTMSSSEPALFCATPFTTGTITPVLFDSYAIHLI